MFSQRLCLSVPHGSSRVLYGSQPLRNVQEWQKPMRLVYIERSLVNDSRRVTARDDRTARTVRGAVHGGGYPGMGGTGVLGHGYHLHHGPVPLY